jgi:hypothetical protein
MPAALAAPLRGVRATSRAARPGRPRRGGVGWTPQKQINCG